MKSRSRFTSPALIAIVYAAVGLVWIIFSDMAMRRLVSAPAIPFIESSKGILFVAATALTLYLLLVRQRIVGRDEFAELEREAAESEQLTRSLSEVRAAQTALSQSEARLRNVIASSLDAIVTVTTDDLILEWNGEAGRLFGWSAAEAIGEKLSEILVPYAQREAYLMALHRFADEGPSAFPVRRFESIAVSRTGREFPIEITVMATEWGDHIVVTGFMRDISDRVRAEQESLHLRAIINGAPFAMIAVDDSGNILSWNPAAQEMYGWTADQVRGSHIRLLMPDEAADAESLVEKVRWGLPVETLQGRHVRRDEKAIDVVWSLTPLPPLDAVHRAVLIAVDLSEQHQLEKRVSDAEYLASLGRIAGTVAHEFNNVLMGIQPFVELLARENPNDRMMRSLSQMRLSIQRGRRVTDDILRFTRASAAPVLQSISVDAWLKGIAPELSQLVGNTIRVTVRSQAPGLDIIGDHAQLNQVLANLALNARDAMPAAGEMTIIAAPCGEPPPGMVRECVQITVTDTGTGMDSDTAAHAFEPLFTTKKRGGTGLGLAVVQKIVHAHGGEISLRSQPGEGTIFSIVLPARHAASQRLPVPHDEPEYAPRRILLIEDDVAIATGLADLLRTYGMIVDIAFEGTGALGVVRAFKPDVVVLDVALPDRSGIEVYHEIAAEFPTLPIVFSTGHADEARLEGPLSRPHVSFLRKPYAVETLLDTISALA